MDESVVSWNIPNFVSINLMVAVLIVLLFAIKKGVAAWQCKHSAARPSRQLAHRSFDDSDRRLPRPSAHYEIQSLSHGRRRGNIRPRSAKLRSGSLYAGGKLNRQPPKTKKEQNNACTKCYY